jgi:hypothetical protein
MAACCTGRAHDRIRRALADRIGNPISLRHLGVQYVPPSIEMRALAADGERLPAFRVGTWCPSITTLSRSNEPLFMNSRIADRLIKTFYSAPLFPN